MVCKHFKCRILCISDEEHNTCGSPQIQPFCLRELIDIRYNIGSIVMAKLPGYPWWPAMIDDDPEFGKFYWLNAQETKTVSHFIIIIIIILLLL